MKQNVKYNSTIAQAIQASGVFLNSLVNPWFFVALILLVGGGFIMYKSTIMISDSIDHVSEKLDQLNNNLLEHKNQTTRQIDILEDISNYIHNYNRKR